MAPPKNTISGLDINKTGICYAKRIAGSMTIANVGIQPVEPGVDDYWKNLLATLEQFIAKIKIQGETVVASLPGEYAVIKKLAVERDEQDVGGTIEWELSQQIIGSIDEYVYDYQEVNGAAGPGHRQYLVAGYRTAAVDRVAGFLKSKKVDLAIVDLDIFALVNVFEKNYDDAVSAPAVIVHSDEARTRLILTVNGDFIDLETFVHSGEMEAVENYCTVVNTAIHKLLSYNTSYGNAESIPAYLTGSYFAKPDTVAEALHGLKMAQMLLPFRKVTCGAEADDEKVRDFSPQLAVSVGLALRDVD